MGVDSHEENNFGLQNADSTQKLLYSDKLKNDIKSNGAVGEISSSFEK